MHEHTPDFPLPEMVRRPETADVAAQMHEQLAEFAREHDLPSLARALDYATAKHEGQYRKLSALSGERLPYIVHPLTMCRHAVSLGVREDDLLSSIMLHDVVEDTGTTLEELPFDESVRHTVDLLSFLPAPDDDKRAAQAEYYRLIQTDPHALVVKILDRCHNVSTMASAFSREKIRRYVRETKEFIWPLYEVIYTQHPQYRDLAQTVEYHTRAVIDSVMLLLDAGEQEAPAAD